MLKSLARVGSVRLYRCIILGNSSLGVEHFAGYVQCSELAVLDINMTPARLSSTSISMSPKAATGPAFHDPVINTHGFSQQMLDHPRVPMPGQ